MDIKDKITKQDDAKAINIAAGQRENLWVSMKNKRLLIAVILSIITFLVYIPALKNGFVNWDDDVYVYNNVHIKQINAEFFKWIFEFYASNWHPLTWLSHAIDYAVWGLNPVGHHLTSILIHSINTFILAVLVFLIINLQPLSEKIFSGDEQRRTRIAVITSGITACLFGVHPLHVESVAWIAERKDVLAAFFVLLSLTMYVVYISRKHAAHFYIASLCLFALALMSKPMAVTVPFILLLLDIFPFRRIFQKIESDNLKRVIIEKIPFLVLSGISIILTFAAQHAGGAIRAFAEYPLSDRILVSIKGFIFYIMKMLFPVSLSSFYPYPKHISLFSLNALLPILFFLTITILCLYAWKKGKKVFLMVWAYYLLTLLPVIGIIQIGDQAAADRYTYIPSIGPFLLVAIVASIFLEKISRGQLRALYKYGGAVLLPFVILLAVLTVKQIGVWKNSEVLWSSVIKKSPEYAGAYLNRAHAFRISGKYQEALKDLDTVIELEPEEVAAYSNRGILYEMMAKYEWALKDLTKAIELDPDSSETYNNRANIFVALNDFKSAMKDLDKAIALKPEKVGSYVNRCQLNSSLGKYQEAIRDCTTAIQIDPKNDLAFTLRGNAYRTLGRDADAITDYNQALSVNPYNADAYFNRGSVYRSKGEYQAAVSDFSRAIAINKQYADAYINRGVTYGEMGEFAKSVQDFTRAIALNPKDASAYYNRGAAYYRLNKQDEAMKDFKKAAQLGERNIQKILRERGVSW